MKGFFNTKMRYFEQYGVKNRGYCLLPRLPLEGKLSRKGLMRCLCIKIWLIFPCIRSDQRGELRNFIYFTKKCPFSRILCAYIFVGRPPSTSHKNGAVDIQCRKCYNVNKGENVYEKDNSFNRVFGACVRYICL